MKVGILVAPCGYQTSLNLARAACGQAGVSPTVGNWTSHIEEDITWLKSQGVTFLIADGWVNRHGLYLAEKAYEQLGIKSVVLGMCPRSVPQQLDPVKEVLIESGAKGYIARCIQREMEESREL